MIVLDASAAIELVLHAATRPALLQRVLWSREAIAAPHLIDPEVLQVLRRLTASREIKPARAAEAFHDYTDLPLQRYSHRAFLGRIWELRANLTAYDAAYVALAESLGCPLVTCDSRLAVAPGHHATIEVIGGD